MGNIPESIWAELSRLGLATNAPDGDWRIEMDEIRGLKARREYPRGAIFNRDTCEECVDTNPLHHHHDISHSHEFTILDHTHDYDEEEK